MSGQYKLPLPSGAAAMSLDDFLVTDSNALAVRWLFETPFEAWPSHVLILHGPHGCGKSHLLQSWRQQIGAMEIHAGDSFLDVDRRASLAMTKGVVLDDADLLTTDDQQIWLQHFYNATKEMQSAVVMAAQKPPAAWGLTLKDIETRLKSCQSVALSEPDDALIRGLFLKLFADRQLRVEDPVLEYLAKRVERTGTAVQELVAFLDEEALRMGRKISIPFVQKVLAGD